VTRCHNGEDAKYLPSSAPVRAAPNYLEVTQPPRHTMAPIDRVDDLLPRVRLNGRARGRSPLRWRRTLGSPRGPPGTAVPLPQTLRSGISTPLSLFNPFIQGYYIHITTAKLAW